MRFAAFCFVALAMALLATVAQPAQVQGPGGGQPGGGVGGPAGFQIDPDKLFDQLARGGDTIVIAQQTGTLGALLEDYAKANKINNGVITRKQFAEFAQQLMANTGGAKGVAAKSFPINPPVVQNVQLPDNKENEVEEQILRSAGLGTDADALLEFFRERTRPNADMGKLLALARQLGDASAQTRAKAAAKLVACGAWAVPALRYVLNELDNPLAAQQARRCLDWVEGPRSRDVPIAAAKLLAARKPAAAAATLLAFLPLADDLAVVDAVKESLTRIAAGPGKIDAAVLAALEDPLPLRRAIAVEVLADSGHPELLTEIRKVLADPKPQVRLRVALALTQRGDEKAIGVLIDLLAELPADESRRAEQTLQQLAGDWSPTVALQGDDELSRKVRLQAWAGWWRTLDGPALLAAFRQRTLAPEDLAKVESLIVQLGDQSFAKRERAVAELVATGTKVVGLLREAAKSKDLEQARRAETCLKRIAQKEETEKLPSAAPRLLAVRKPAGASAALLAFLPFTEDRLMKEEIGKALKSLVFTSGQPDPAVLNALTDKLPMRRIAAAEALASAGGAAHPAVHKLLKDADPEVRLRVAVALVYARDKDAVPALIDLLAELPRSQAWEAEELLYRMAGAKAPAAPSGDDAAARKKLREVWQAWWKVHGAAVDLANLEKVTSISGLTVVAELGTKGKAAPAIKAAAVPLPANALAGPDRIVAIDRKGQPHWQIENLEYPIDFQVLPGDRVLVAEYAAKRVTERDLKGKIIWQTTDLPGAGAPINVQRLANGNTFIAVYSGAANGTYSFMEVDRSGKTVSTITKQNKGAAPPVTYLRAAYKTADGHVVCLLSNSTCVRMDASGKEIRSFAVTVLAGVNYFGNLDVTAKGNVLLFQNANTLTEFSPDGKIIGQFNINGNRAIRLSNGNTLVASQSGGVTELDSAGKTAWQYQPPPGYQAIRARQQGDRSSVYGYGLVGALPPVKADYGGIESDVVAAWEKAGGQFGWLEPRPSGNSGFVNFTTFRPANPSAVPAFRFADAPRQGAMVALPVPNVPLGLDFQGLTVPKGGAVKVTVTDAHLKELARLKQLQTLNLAHTPVTDAGLKELAGLRQLQALTLWDTQVTDVGMKQLTGFQQLQKLDLGETKVGDAGLKELAVLQQLQTLHLGGTQVTDAGLKHLVALQKLQTLQLHSTWVTAAGVAELQKALPNCRITAPNLKAKAK